jgi:phosphopentomutase
MGARATFADIAASGAAHLGLSWSGAGKSFLPGHGELTAANLP